MIEDSLAPAEYVAGVVFVASVVDDNGGNGSSDVVSGNIDEPFNNVDFVVDGILAAVVVVVNIAAVNGVDGKESAAVEPNSELFNKADALLLPVDWVSMETANQTTMRQCNHPMLNNIAGRLVSITYCFSSVPLTAYRVQLTTAN